MAGRESQQLPQKEAGLFRQVVKFYESKQYKKGIKAADQILKKKPDHGETLAMKGLILSNQDKKEEAYELVRRGLRADLKSHVCWHVYGLLWRADNNYDEAIKCYKNALRIDRDNQQILRDLALLQIQMRDLAGFVETRQTLLQLKAANRINWISFAIAHHLAGDHELAVRALDGFASTQEEAAPGEAYEHSELLLYKAQVLEEGGQAARALAHLQAARPELRDVLGCEEACARLQLKLGEASEAAVTYRRLLEQNPDNHQYQDGLRAALGLPTSGEDAPSPQQVEQLQKLYEELAVAHPRSSALRRVPLDFLDGAPFEAALEAYVRRFLVKGIPSLFSDLKGLYSSPAKTEAIERHFEWLAEALRADPERLPARSGGDAVPAGEAALWTKLFLAQHYDRRGQTERALALADECGAAGGEEIEVLRVRGRALKHAGDLDGAAAAAVRAQGLDLADRYLNSMAAKALFRAGHVARAERMAARFTKDSGQANPLYEMQCTWYEIECGHACLRRHDHGRALKNFLAVVKHFETFREDQFDFHGYCVRKMTLRSYVSMLRMEDTLLESTFFAQGVWGAVETYLALADGAGQQADATEEAARLAGLSLEEQKKQKLKQKKEAAKAAKAEEEKRTAAEAAKAGGKKAAKDSDPDPDGAALAAVADPLAEAAKLLRKLCEGGGSQLRTHLLSFEVALRRGKLLLALQAVRRAAATAGPASPDVHRATVRFCAAAAAQPVQNGSGGGEATPAVVRQLLDSHVQRLLGGRSLQAFADAYASAHAGSSLAARAANAEVQVLLQPAAKDKILASLLAGGLEGATLEEAIDAHRMLRSRLAASVAADQWAAAARERFPRSRYFGGSCATPEAELAGLLEVPDGAAH